MFLKIVINFKKIILFIWALFALRNCYWAKIITKYRINPKKVHISKPYCLLSLPDIGLRLEKNSDLYILERYSDAVRLVNSAEAKFQFNAAGKIIATIEGLRFVISTSQILQILKEVFIDGIYDIQYPRPVVIVDIGMNVGIVSLLLAKRLKAPVFAYEPFPKTFKYAQENFSLNREVSDSVRSFNFGLGMKEDTVKAVYCPDASGDCGVISIQPEYQQGRQTEMVDIGILCVNDVFDLVLKEYPDREILLKVDCEGSEYEIIQSLIESGYIKEVSIIMMEWHIRSSSHDPSVLSESLNREGFTLLKRGCFSEKVGMIYAFQNYNFSNSKYAYN
jgi:FkbM family methyltransferase